MQDLGVNAFGPFRLMQFAAVVLVFIGFAVAVVMGLRDKRRGAPSEYQTEQRLFFDGPINAIIGLLKEIRDSSRRVEDHVEPIGEQMRNQTRELTEIKRLLDDVRNHKRGR